MKALVLTLGHGSSAILIDDDVIINGYQNERVTKIKSDSQFPLHAIEEILKYDDIPKDVVIYVSHWEPTGNINNMSKRHWNPDYLKRKFPKSKIESHNIDFTHHDAHAYSALAYFRNTPNGTHIIVADGFGNYGQVLTIYEMRKGTPRAIFSSHNYDASLGLLYQYATDFVGLKMNQDEWKLNAASTTIDITKSARLLEIADHITSIYINKITISRESEGDPLMDLGALSYTHKMVVDLLSTNFEKEDKAEIAFVLQLVVERCIMYLIDYFGIKHVRLVGGVFMNVQLNGYIAGEVTSVGVMPLSGDSGAGLGVYKHLNPKFYIPKDFCWGKRKLEGLISPNLHYTKNLIGDIKKYLHEGHIVNVVRGKMEFGERAYCNTSTIAFPTKENAMLINSANGRDSSMPMAPVVSIDLYHRMFRFGANIIQSVQHMIMAMPYNNEWSNNKDIEGVSHYVPAQEVFTGRPQVVSNDHFMSKVTKTFGPLINTSFNIHGQPICMSPSDVLKAHMYQQSHTVDNKFVTLIEVNNEQV